MRLPLYIYSNKNIAGSALALGAVGAYLAGAINDFWPLIVAGAYGIGALAVPSGGRLETTLSAEMDADAMIAGLRKLGADAQRSLPADLATLVNDICTTIISMVPLLAKRTAVDQSTYDIKRTAAEYLPETLQAYLALPPAFRNLQPVAGGKTPKALLTEQLTLLDGKMKEIAADLLADDTQHLVANGQFLREKFPDASFLHA